jgi:DNA-directed RNA polymerase subunit alpha
MTIDLTGLVRPHLVEMAKRDDNPNAAEFRLQPLERGYGYTLGNALRRLLLSSLRGTGVWGFRMDGVVHEHQTVQGVLEDVHQIIQRLKALTLVLSEDVHEAVLTVKREGPGPVYARDIEFHSAVEVGNPDHLLFTVQDDREVSAELHVNKGRGYVEAELHDIDRSLPVDLVRIDSIYNPVLRANFAVAETRVGQRTDYDRLTVFVETNGTISPEDAIAYAAALAQEHFQYFRDFGRVPTAPQVEEEIEITRGVELVERLSKPIDDLGLSVRALNSLKNSSIRSLKDLVELSEDDLLKVKNVGEKALTEIGELLEREGFNFKMVFETDEEGLRIVDAGVPPALRVGGSAEAPPVETPEELGA